MLKGLFGRKNADPVGIATINDRQFVLGLDDLFREHMKAFEVSTLLPLARRIDRGVGGPIPDVPVEGYYTESNELREYFTIVRKLQNTEAGKVPADALADLSTLSRVLSSRAFGRIQQTTAALPLLSNPLNAALLRVPEWTIDNLMSASIAALQDSDACLVSVAIQTADPVCVCATRETLALELLLAAGLTSRATWGVSPAVAQRAQKLIETLRADTGIVLPQAVPESADVYWAAAQTAETNGRCVAIGQAEMRPDPYYHWRIEGEGATAKVIDFWDDHIVTTADIRGR